MTDKLAPPAAPGRSRQPFTREQRTTILYGILGTILIIVILQTWLLVTTMNAYLGGDFAVVWPTAAVSILCLLLNLGLLRYIRALER